MVDMSRNNFQEAAKLFINLTYHSDSTIGKYYLLKHRYRERKKEEEIQTTRQRRINRLNNLYLYIRYKLENYYD